jgi:hypothetical protein
MAVPVYIPTTSIYKYSLFSTSSLTYAIYVIFVFFDNHSSRYYYDFNYHFPSD